MNMSGNYLGCKPALPSHFLFLFASFTFLFHTFNLREWWHSVAPSIFFLLQDLSFPHTWMTVVTSNSSSTPSSSTPKECSSGAMEEGEILGVGQETTSSDVGLLLGLFNSSHLLSGWFNRRCSHTLTGNHDRNQVYAKDRAVLTWIPSYLIRTAGSSLLYMEETRGQKRYLQKLHWS